MRKLGTAFFLYQKWTTYRIESKVDYKLFYKAGGPKVDGQRFLESYTEVLVWEK